MSNYLGEALARMQGQVGQRIQQDKAAEVARQAREAELARQGVLDRRYTADKVLEATRYKTEQDWRVKQQAEQERAWSQAEKDRKKAESVKEAIKSVDLNFSPSADRRIAGVENYIGDLSSKVSGDKLEGTEFLGEVGRVDGTGAEKKQHALFIDKINKAYEEVGLLDKADAYEEAYRAYRSVDATPQEAEAGAKVKTAGMLSKAEKREAAQSQLNQEYEDMVAHYDRVAESAHKQGDWYSKEQIAKAKARASQYKTTPGSSYNGDSEKASKDISTFLGTKEVEGNEVKNFNKAMAAAKKAGYTTSQIASVLPSSTEEGKSFLGMFNVYDPEVNTNVLMDSLVTHYKEPEKRHGKSNPSNNGPSKLDLAELEILRNRLKRGTVEEKDSKTSAQVLADFKRGIRGEEEKGARKFKESTKKIKGTDHKSVNTPLIYDKDGKSLKVDLSTSAKSDPSDSIRRDNDKFLEEHSKDINTPKKREEISNKISKGDSSAYVPLTAPVEKYLKDKGLPHDAKSVGNVLNNLKGKSEAYINQFLDSVFYFGHSTEPQEYKGIPTISQEEILKARAEALQNVKDRITP